jgi:hypothetical protein
MSSTKHNVEDFVSEFFATKNPYNKYYSPENLNKIVGRVASFRIHPSSTAVKRAILELAEEGQIERTDGKDETDDAREAEEAAQERDRQLAFAKPLTQADASVYASLSFAEIAYRFNSDRVWRFRYEAACRLFGFRLPIAVMFEESKEPEESIPELTAEEYRRIPVRTIQMRYKNDPKFRAGVEKLIADGRI